MSTLELRAAHRRKSQSPFSGFARFISILREVLDAFDEARRQAHEAERRYPFTS